jgi:hypothetical protein
MAARVAVVTGGTGGLGETISTKCRVDRISDISGGPRLLERARSAARNQSAQRHLCFHARSTGFQTKTRSRYSRRNRPNQAIDERLRSWHIRIRLDLLDLEYSADDWIIDVARRR